MLTGLDLRRYRKATGRTQAEFAERMGLAQATLSQIEIGRIRFSDEHLQRARSAFIGPEFSPTFADFEKRVESGGLGAVPTPDSLHVTIPVWTYDETFDLARRPAPGDAVDLVTVRSGAQPVLALRMDRGSEEWTTGETFVFARCGANDVSNGDLCLLQVRGQRGRSAHTTLARARVLQAARGKTYQFEPIQPAGPMLAADESVQAVLRAVYRGRYLSQ